MSHRPRTRRANLEPLETRFMLAVDSLAAPALSAEAADSAQDPIIIEAIHLRVGDREYSIDKRNEVVIYEEGETLDVVGVDYVVSSEGAALDGVVAFEGYLRGSSKNDWLGEFDYANGRFGDPSNGDRLQEGTFEHQGLNGQWELEDSINRLSVALVRYHGDAWEAHDRFFVNLQRGSADVEMLGAVYKRRGHSIEFAGAIANKGREAVTTYSEVDVYHVDDLSTPVWVGVFSTTINSGKQVVGRYRNDHPTDGFDRLWTPTKSGTYIVKFYVDPENAIAEESETNNVIVGKIQV